MADRDDEVRGDPVSCFRRAVSLGASLVEGTATTISAEDADVLHDPLVATALQARGTLDPVFACKLAGRHGAWVGPPDGDLVGLDEERLADIFALRASSPDARVARVSSSPT